MKIASLIVALMGLLAVANGAAIESDMTDLRASRTYSGARTYTYSRTYTYYKPTTYYSYHTYGYYYGGRSTIIVGGVGGTICGLVCCILCIVIVLAICRRGGSEVVIQDGGYETVTETVVEHHVENGPQAHQVPPPYPPAFPGGPTTAWCKNGHAMTWVQGNPYSHQGDDGPVCDNCQAKFDYNLTFAHCYNCEDDLCLNCAPAQVR